MKIKIDNIDFETCGEEEDAVDYFDRLMAWCEDNGQKTLYKNAEYAKYLVTEQRKKDQLIIETLTPSSR